MAPTRWICAIIWAWLALECVAGYAGDRVLLEEIQVSRRTLPAKHCSCPEETFGDLTGLQRCVACWCMRLVLQSLTLHAGEMTTGRRTAPVPQLECRMNCDGAPDVVQCVNMGGDGYNVNWKCEASTYYLLQ
jgi:hypothetical protein